MYKVLVTGANGQLGQEFKYFDFDTSSFEFVFLDKSECDITDVKKLEQTISNVEVDVIVNCAAYTAVDKAEEEKVLADTVNNKAIHNLAVVCRKNNIKLIHISTDYVFDGTSNIPYLEDVVTSPINEYGASKLKGELSMIEENPSNSIIIRTSWVYSKHGKNFVNTMLNLGKNRSELGIVSDQVGSPTYTKDLVRAILKIIPQLKNENVEVFNFSNLGVCSWYDFAHAIFEIKKMNLSLNALRSEDFPTPAARPKYSVLSKSKIIKTYNLDIPHWRDSLKECLQ